MRLDPVRKRQLMLPALFALLWLWAGPGDGVQASEKISAAECETQGGKLTYAPEHEAMFCCISQGQQSQCYEFKHQLDQGRSVSKATAKPPRRTGAGVRASPTH